MYLISMNYGIVCLSCDKHCHRPAAALLYSSCLESTIQTQILLGLEHMRLILRGQRRLLLSNYELDLGSMGAT